MPAKSRKPAQDTRTDLEPPKSQHAATTSGSDSASATAVAAPVSLLELAAREWDSAIEEGFGAASAFSEAGAALSVPSNREGFDGATASGIVALEESSSHEREARAYAMGTLGEEKVAADLQSQQRRALLDIAMFSLRSSWNARMLSGPLGIPFSIPWTGGPEAARASLDARWTDLGMLTLTAEIMRRHIPEIPAERPKGGKGLALQRLWNDNAARSALMGLFASLDGHYGHQWIFLFEEAKAAGLPAWAAADIGTDVAGAAAYEARLQDAGKLSVDPEKIDRLAHQIRRATDGHGTKESMILNAEVRNLTRPEIEALEAEYQERFGASVFIDLDMDLSGEDDSEAFRSMSGDPVRAAIEALENRIDDDVCDPDEIIGVIRALPPSERARFQEMRKTDPHLQEIERRVLSARYFDDEALKRDYRRNDREMLAAWFSGDIAAAESVSLEESAIDRSYIDQHEYNQRPSEVKLGEQEVVTADLKRIVKELEKSDDPRALEAAFDRSHPYTLRQWVASSGDQPQRDLVYALLDTTKEQREKGERSPEEIAARVRIGSGKEIKDALKDPDLSSSDPEVLAKAKERRAKLDAVFAERYGREGETSENALGGHIGRKFGNEDERNLAYSVYDDGKEDIAIGAWLAMYEAGTKEDRLKDLFRGASASEMATARSKFEGYTGYGFDWMLGDELSGEEEFDIKLLARGQPETPEQALSYAKERQGYHRGGGTWQGVTDWTEQNLFDSHTFADTDRQYSMFEELFDKGGKLKPGVDPAYAMRVYRWHSTAVEDYAQAKAMVVEAIAHGAEILVAALVTVLTEGATSPWLVRALAAVAGTAAYVSTKALLSTSVTAGTVATDVVVGLAAAALSVAAEARLLAKGASAAQGVRMLAVMGDDAIKVGGAAFRDQVIRKAVALIVENGGAAAVETALADGTWENGLDSAFLAIFGSALREAGVSLVTLDLAPDRLQNKAVDFLLQTGTQWIVQSPDESESVAFVIHRVLQAGATTAQWASEPSAEMRAQRRAQRAEQRASSLDEGSRQRIRAETKRALDEALRDATLSEATKERLRAWADQYDAQDLAFDTSTGATAPDALGKDEAEGTKGQQRPPRSSGTPASQQGASPEPWHLRHTGQRAMYEGRVWVVLSNEDDHFTLMRQNEDGAPVIITVDSKKLLESETNDHLVDDLPSETVSMPFDGTDHSGANTLYRAMIADDASREAAVYYNPETGQYITIQGEQATVQVAQGQAPAPGGIAQAWKELLTADRGAWVLIRHYHPSQDPARARLMQLPSDGWGDMGIVYTIGRYYGEISTSLIDTVAPWGEPTTTRYGYDPHTGKFFVDWEESKGQRTRRDFDSLADYHTFLGTQGGRVNPVPQVPAAATPPPAPSQRPMSPLDEATKARLGEDVSEDRIHQMAADLGPELLKTLSRALPGAKVAALYEALTADGLLRLRAALGDNVFLRLAKAAEPEALERLASAALQAPLSDYLNALGDKLIPFGTDALVAAGALLTPEALRQTLAPFKVKEVPFAGAVLSSDPALLSKAVSHFGGGEALGGLLHDAHSAGMPPATAARLLDQSVRLGWRSRETLGEFLLHGNGRWEEVMRIAEGFHQAGNSFGLKSKVDGGLPGSTIVTAHIGSNTVIATDTDLAHYKSGHTFEEYALTMNNAGRGAESSMWPVGTTDAVILADLQATLADPAAVALAAQAAASGRAEGTIDGYFLGLTRVGSDVRAVQFFPDPGRPAIPKSQMRAVVKLFESR